MARRPRRTRFPDIIGNGAWSAPRHLEGASWRTTASSVGSVVLHHAVIGSGATVGANAVVPNQLKVTRRPRLASRQGARGPLQCRDDPFLREQYVATGPLPPGPPPAGLIVQPPGTRSRVDAPKSPAWRNGPRRQRHQVALGWRRRVHRRRCMSRSPSTTSTEAVTAAQSSSAPPRRAARKAASASGRSPRPRQPLEDPQRDLRRLVVAGQRSDQRRGRVLLREHGVADAEQHHTPNRPGSRTMRRKSSSPPPRIRRRPPGREERAPRTSSSTCS